MLSKFGHFAIALVLTLPAWCADQSASISGYVRSANGVPQMGAAVEVLGAAVPTLKISAPSFLPTLREKIGVKAGASVLLNLTLSTLFDAIQFAPRRGNADDGDWDWVLRSTSNRPVLRILPDGSPVVVPAKAGEPTPDLRGTLSLVAGAPAQGFGSVSDVSTGFLVEKSMFSTGTLSFHGDVGYGTGLPNAVVRTSYKHQVANGSTPEVALTVRRLSTPDFGLRNAQLQALALSVSNDMNLGDVLELKFGSELQTIQFMGKVTAFRPFGSVSAHLSPDTMIEYRYSTSRPDSRAQKGFETSPADLSETDPRVSMAGFTPALERAHHQEIALSHR